MSKGYTAENFLAQFPEALNGSRGIRAIASIVAEELMELYKQTELVTLFSRIDELDGTILDTLAYDFKIDWWDADAEIDIKRKVLKSCFAVHRKLGTAGALRQALSDEYESARVLEWFEYSGQPYHYKLELGIGGEMYTSDRFRRAVQIVGMFANVRSVLDQVILCTEREAQMYIGFAVGCGVIVSYEVAGIDALIFLVDEDEDYLATDDGEFLIY